MLKVKVYPHNINSIHLSQIYTGLFDLENQRKIIVKFTQKFPHELRNSRPRITLWLNVEDSESGKALNLCFDMHDSGKIFAVERLQLCDIYYKRSYHQKYIESLQGHLQKKIVPFGLNYACRCKNQRHSLKRLLVYNIINHNFYNLKKHPVKIFKENIIELLKALSLTSYPPLDSQFEMTPDSPSEPKILFQTRLWEHKDKMEVSIQHLTKINEMRAHTVNALKREFGDRFIGGLYPTRLAKESYPNCLTNQGTGKENYMNLVKSCLIGVTTTGLHNSIGWKFTEYLAASRCIITEPLYYTLPVPLVEGKNYLSFRTPEECVNHAKRILNNKDFSNEMRRNNHDYYLTEIKPSSVVYRCLNTPFKETLEK